MSFERVSDSTASRADVKDLPDDPRLMRAVEEYLAQLEAGQRGQGALCGGGRLHTEACARLRRHLHLTLP